MKTKETKSSLYKAAIDYHTFPSPGKLSIVPTKSLTNQRELSLAYSPGVAAACHEITKDPNRAGELTCRSNLVAVITNGTAVLGLGNIGALSSKPVMEGKAVLFKEFAGINVFDLEINEPDPKKLVEIIASLEPTFGGINLEDIKAPDCFYVERELQKKVKIPVFHDDQHGTAIIVAAAIKNSLFLTNKKINEIKVVVCGAGASAIACLDLLTKMGLPLKNIYLNDSKGLITDKRKNLNPEKKKYQQQTQLTTLEESMDKADVFIGLSVKGTLTASMLKKMNTKPIVFALANPDPEMLPSEIRKHRPDAIVATGRSDFPNQVNNILCFPFIFRGALDVAASTINHEMKIACVNAISNIAHAELPDTVAQAYTGKNLQFGPDYIIPKPFDPRLLSIIAPAVAKAAMDTGVAQNPISNLEEYTTKLSDSTIPSSMLMKPIFNIAANYKKTIVFSEGENKKVLSAVQESLEENIVKPILIGRKEIIAYRHKQLGLRFDLKKDVEIISPLSDQRFKKYWQCYLELMCRKGLTPDLARMAVRTNSTIISALMVHLNDADGMVVGPLDQYLYHLTHIKDIIGLADGVSSFSSLSALIIDNGAYFFCDPFVNKDPTVEQIVESTLLATKQVERFGIKPHVALLSHSNFGSSTTKNTKKMQEALIKIREMNPHLDIDGEMQPNIALDTAQRKKIFPYSLLQQKANVFIMPDVDSAYISMSLMRTLSKTECIGPMLLGAKKPVHILSMASGTRSILNMTALCAVESLPLGDIHG